MRLLLTLTTALLLAATNAHAGKYHSQKGTMDVDFGEIAALFKETNQDVSFYPPDTRDAAACVPAAFWQYAFDEFPEEKLMAVQNSGVQDFTTFVENAQHVNEEEVADLDVGFAPCAKSGGKLVGMFCFGFAGEQFEACTMGRIGLRESGNRLSEKDMIDYRFPPGGFDGEGSEN